jgi:isoleucyl-tRNA synthetase
MEGYEVHRATRAIEAFVVDDLSNWYVRRSRRRVWGGAMDDDKAACYGTLREALHTLGRLTAPMIPFLSEEIYLGVRGPSEHDSVHLADWPKADSRLRDADLESSMALARQVCDAVRAMRAADDIKNRQPLRRAVLVGEDARLRSLGPLLMLIADESNVKEVGQAATMEQFLERRARPNMGRLGPRFKGEAPKVAKAVHEADASKLLAEVESKGSATLPGGYTVAMGDLVVDSVDKGGFRTQQVGDISVVLDVQLDDALVAEGFAREVVRRVQEMRKDMDLDLEEEVAVSIAVDATHKSMLERHLPHLKGEVRASSVALPALAPGGTAPKGPGHKDWDIDGVAVSITLARAR